VCRRSGLEAKRRCGRIDRPASGTTRPVWARGGVAIDCCPRSYITVESECLVEDFFVRRRATGTMFDDLDARQVEAFVILEQALADEMSRRS